MNQLMDLRLSVDEAQLLSQLLKADRTRLVEEIHHTDAREFRDFLKRREELLDRVLQQLNS